MKVIVMSDLHGELYKIGTSFDLLLICGDVCPVWSHGRKFQEDWLNDDFVEWVLSLPFNNENSRVVMIAGNHDFYLEGITKKNRKNWVSKFEGRLVYLDNEEYVHNHEGNEYRIFGCPYCRPLPKWAFVRDNLDKYYKYIPDNLDILMTHDAANFDELGITVQGRNAGRNFGNDVLAKYVEKTKPKYYFCGHIHTGKHGLREYKGINIANVSILDEDYYVSFKPLELEIKK